MSKLDELIQELCPDGDASAVPSTGSVIAFDEGDVLIGNIRPYLRKETADDDINRD